MDNTVVVKTEMQSNGEILLFYVDENGGNEEGVLTTVQNIENQAIELQQDNNSYILPDVGDYSTELSEAQTTSQNDDWTDDDIRRLLIFYTDNKQSFVSGTTKKKHLWTVACKTMLLGKTPSSCETELNSLKEKYLEICGHIQKGLYVKWPYFELCHQVFHDDNSKTSENYEELVEPQIANVSVAKPSHESIMVVKKVGNRPTPDSKVELMLKLYLKYKENFQQEYRRKGLWETIALELGEDDGEYWQKRFLNYKQHYSRLLEKRRVAGSETINWPYMELFDKIFEGDEEFHRKYLNQETRVQSQVTTEDPKLDWDNTEMTVLVKYCFDCFDEFEDRTIPNNFLWNEIGRLLDKSADACKKKYEEMKNEHLNKYIEGGYDLRSRKPVSILYDNIISKEIELSVIKMRDQPEELEVWKTEEVDELVQFFYANIEMYKDGVCHYVCWAAIVKKLNRDLQSCRGQWEDLVSLYKTILNDKKENPDMQIDWRYIELFDRIFDYGMDTKLLSGYEKMKAPSQDSGKIGVKKIRIKSEDLEEDFSEDDESFDERGFTKRTKRRTGDSKAFKILEYYQKNKDKFSTTNRNKHSLWEVLAKQIGISATQCAHRFRNLKQVYTAYVQREINKPEMPILWPYYALCKKVFGYRAIKSKLKNGKLDSDDSEDWSAKEIKQLINYFSKNYDDINSNIDDSNKWADLAGEIGKGEHSCKDKFLELRKSYRKLKTMRSRNPDVKISWKYFAMFEQIYSAREEGQEMEVDGATYMELPMESDERNDGEDDEYQCIIVIPEGGDMENAQIIMQDPSEVMSEDIETTITETLEENTNELQEQPKPIAKWTNRTKKRLLINYINYVRSHKGKEIISKDMWNEISAKLGNKTPIACKKMLAKLKATYRDLQNNDPNIQLPRLYTLMQKVMRCKPKYVKNDENKALRDVKIYKDVVLPDEKVLQALQYYLENIEDFVSPRFEKKYLWTGLANAVNEPVTKVFNKINYLKQSYNSDTDEVAGEKTPFGALIKEILAKEIAIKLVLENEPKPVIDDSDTEVLWNNDETEQLLEWYLSNLEKFKNPKFVRSYLWMEVSGILNKSAIACSKKMSEIRTQYRNMVRESPDELAGWRFLDLCQKIYGTGKKGNQPLDGSSVA